MKSQSRSPVNFLVPPSRYLDARTSYYRELVRRAFDDMCLEPFGRLTAEHSAQLTGQEDEEAFNKTERYELWFQDIPRAVARYSDWTGNFPTLRLSNGRRQFLGVEDDALDGGVPPVI